MSNSFICFNNKIINLKKKKANKALEVYIFIIVIISYWYNVYNCVCWNWKINEEKNNSKNVWFYLQK